MENAVIKRISDLLDGNSCSPLDELLVSQDQILISISADDCHFSICFSNYGLVTFTAYAPHSASYLIFYFLCKILFNFFVLFRLLRIA